MSMSNARHLSTKFDQHLNISYRSYILSKLLYILNSIINIFYDKSPIVCQKCPRSEFLYGVGVF